MGEARRISKHPHENPDVLHEPGLCESCDDYSERQILRANYGINFTGNNVPGLLPCPSTYGKPFYRVCSTHGDYESDKECPGCVEEKTAEAKSITTYNKLIIGGNSYSLRGWTNPILEYTIQDTFQNGATTNHFVGNRRYEHPSTETCVHCR